MEFSNQVEATSVLPVPPVEKTIFDLPVVDILVTHVAPYLKWRDVLNLSVCSRYFLEIAVLMTARLEEMRSRNVRPEMRRPLRRLLREMPNTSYRLKRLELFNLPYLTDENVTKLLTNKPNLELLIIRKCRLISQHVIFPLISDLKSLIGCDLPDIEVNKDFLEKFHEKNTNLVSVCLHGDYTRYSREIRNFLVKQTQLKRISLHMDIPLETVFQIQRECKSWVVFGVVNLGIEPNPRTAYETIRLNRVANIRRS